MSSDSKKLGSINQWPRWEVFKQDTATKVHQAVGSVHAVDGEHALLMARSVFARRPSAVSMWVVDAENIISFTKEMLAKGLDFSQFQKNEALEQKSVFYIFVKTTNKRSMTFVNHIGEVEALSIEDAFKLAGDLATLEDADVLTWWIIPEDNLVKSDTSNETIESWFAPAKDKTYKQQSSYGQVGNRPARVKRKTK